MVNFALDQNLTLQHTIPLTEVQTLRNCNWHVCTDGGLRHGGGAAMGMVIYYSTDGEFHCVHRSDGILQGVKSAFLAELVALENGLEQFAKMAVRCD